MRDNNSGSASDEYILTGIGKLASDLGADIETCRNVRKAIPYCEIYEENLSPISAMVIDDARAYRSELDADKGNALSGLVYSAATLAGDGQGGESGENGEYERGMAELIARHLNMSSGDVPGILEAIHAAAVK